MTANYIQDFWNEGIFKTKFIQVPIKCVNLNAIRDAFIALNWAMFSMWLTFEWKKNCIGMKTYVQHVGMT